MKTPNSVSPEPGTGQDALRLAAATLGLCLLQTSRGVAMDSEAGYGDAEYGPRPSG
jgi:hypothetical protein